MARIRFYPEDNTLHPSDHIIGTDEVTGAGATRVFTVQALTDYLVPVIGDAFDIDAVIESLEKDEDLVGNSIINRASECDGDQTLTNGSPYDIYVFRTSLGVPKMEIHTGANGLTHDFSTFFSHAITTSEGDGVVGNYDGYIDSELSSGKAYVFTITGISGLPVATQISEAIATDITLAAAGDQPILCYTVGIAADTTINGDLIIEGDIIVDGMPIDLGDILVRLGDAENNITANTTEITNKADRSELHPAASLPVPNPPTAGTATTAITGISLDPATQELTVTRGTVPVVIGGMGTGGGGTEVSFNSAALTEINIPSTSTGNVDFTLNGIDLEANVDLSTVDVYTFSPQATPSTGFDGNVVFDVVNNSVTANVDLTDYTTNGDVTTILGDYYDKTESDALYAPIMHNHPLSGLEDVDITGLTDGDILYWDNASSRWKVKPENIDPAADVNIDLRYIGETFDANDNILEGNKVINIDSYDLNGNPSASTDQFSIPLASESEFGLVRLSRFVQDSIQECDTMIVPGFSSEEITYDVASVTTVTETIDFGAGTSTMWVGEGQFAGQSFYVNSGDIPDSVSGVDGTLIGSGRLAEGYTNAKYVDIAGIYVNPIGAPFPSSADLELSRSAGDTVTGLGLNLAFMRTTGKVKTVEVVYTPLYSITEPFYELELVTFDYQPVTVSGSHEIVSMLGLIDELIFNEDDEIIENCIEITAPLVINQLITGDNIINLGSGSGSGQIQIFFKQPADGVDAIVISEGSVVETLLGDAYLYTGTDDLSLDSNTDFTSSDFIKIGGDLAGITFTDGTSDIGENSDIVGVDFDPDGETTSVTATVDLADYERRVSHGSTLPTDNATRKEDSLFVLLSTDGGNVPGIYRWDGTAWTIIANVGGGGSGGSGVDYFIQSNVDQTIGAGDLIMGLDNEIYLAEGGGTLNATTDLTTGYIQLSGGGDGINYVIRQPNQPVTLTDGDVLRDTTGATFIYRGDSGTDKVIPANTPLKGGGGLLQDTDLLLFGQPSGFTGDNVSISYNTDETRYEAGLVVTNPSETAFLTISDAGVLGTVTGAPAITTREKVTPAQSGGSGPYMASLSLTSGDTHVIQVYKNNSGILSQILPEEIMINTSTNMATIVFSFEIGEVEVIVTG